MGKDTRPAEQKIEDLRQCLAERFAGFGVEPAVVDDGLECRFELDFLQETSKSRQLSILQNAVDDLSPASITALLNHPDAEKLRSTLGVRPPRSVYDLSGRYLPPG